MDLIFLNHKRDKRKQKSISFKDVCLLLFFSFVPFCDFCGSIFFYNLPEKGIYEASSSSFLVSAISITSDFRIQPLESACLAASMVSVIKSISTPRFCIFN
jgi:hypothetical protein